MLSDSKTRRRRISAQAARVLHCCLLLAAWQGPIPLWHCHGTLNASGAAESLTLAAHLKLFHPIARTCGQETLGWHWHFLPGPTSDDSPDPTEQGDLRVPLRISADNLTDLVASVARAASTTQCAVLALDEHPVLAVARLPELGHFYESFARWLPLPLRFCVARC